MDFNGLFPTILAGAIGGAVINTVAYTVGAVISGDKITVEGLASSAASGAVVGGMLGAGITNPAILGAAGGAASSLVSGAMNGQSGKELLHTTKVGALQGGVMGLAFSTLGPAATIATGAVMKGGQNLIEQVFDDDPGVDWISVGRHTLGGAAETGTAMLGYSKMGSYLSGKQKSIVGQKTEAAYNKMVKGVKQTAYNAQRNIQQAVRNMGEMLSPRNQLSTPEGFTFDAFGYENGDTGSVRMASKMPNNNIQGDKDGFTIGDWAGYPDAPKPEGPFKAIEGEEYVSARTKANRTNAKIHSERPDLAGLQIHEMHPVKFGGSPTDYDNKIALTPKEHAAYTRFWNNILRQIGD